MSISFSADFDSGNIIVRDGEGDRWNLDIRHDKDSEV